MQLRAYCSQDCEAMAALFYDTVHIVNAADYSQQQCDAWATGKVDLAQWDRSFCRHYTLVAWEGDEIIGFGDIDKSGYLDRLYVHHAHQRSGIGSALLAALERAANTPVVTTHASLTAVPFFKAHGYVVLTEQTVLRHGIALKNYVMEKEIKLGV